MDVDRQWLCRRIVEDAGEAVMFADLEGTIRLWNDAAERIFGFSREEAVGSSLDIIVPEEFRDPHWDGYFDAIEAGETRAPDDRLTTAPRCTRTADASR
ncbi:PAS domain S-box protein [Haloplanus sp. GCM10025708]|uniref:PAS domain S-box protein n=1 Tax=Haloplanus sp. GCM10025708 TaxID=3252679 RepID=UPI00360DC833